MSADVGLYIHIPFCRRKCAYCDFVSYAGREALFALYVDAAHREMTLCCESWNDVRFTTLYIGGGTPTVLSPAALGGLIDAARRLGGLGADAEITVEANPGTLDAAALSLLRQAGVNRLSLGAQSFDPAMLCLLGRIHTADQIGQAVQMAREAGLNNLNLDLMFGLPAQSPEAWQADVHAALRLDVPHLSLYALTLEDGTPLQRRIAAGELPQPDDDLAADMYEWAEETLERAGYEHYEISNWARPGHACQHNLIYWRNRPYLGLGTAAHSWWGGRRWANVTDPQAYIAALQDGQRPVAASEDIDVRSEMGETMMMGLRLVQEGVSAAAFDRRFGIGLYQVYGREIAELMDEGLLEQVGDSVRLSWRGHLLGNRAFERFI